MMSWGVGKDERESREARRVRSSIGEIGENGARGNAWWVKKSRGMRR